MHAPRPASPGAMNLPPSNRHATIRTMLGRGPAVNVSRARTLRHVGPLAALCLGFALYRMQTAYAQAAEPEVGNGVNALPGVDIVPLLVRPSSALAATATLGYGYTEDVLDADDSHHRMATALAVGYGALPWLSLAA